MESAEVLGKGHLLTSMSGYDWYDLHLSDGNLLGLGTESRISWARDELGWCWLGEESQGTEFMEGNSFAGRQFTHMF